MSDLYYSPEKYGLRPLGEVEWSSGSYEFDTTAVWQDVQSGAVYLAQDSGCSCPIPFEGFDRSNITPITRSQDLIDHFESVKKDSYWWGDDEYYSDRRSTVEGQIGTLVAKVREALR